MAGDKRKKKIKEHIILKQVTATSFNPTPRNEQVTRVKAPVSFFARPKPKIVVPRSFFAPKQHGNACYAGYLASASRGSAFHVFLVKMKIATNLKFSQIHIQCTIKPKRGSDGRHNLTNQTVQIGVRRSIDIEVPTAQVVNSLVIDHKGTVGMLQGSVRR